MISFNIISDILQMQFKTCEYSKNDEDLILVCVYKQTKER